MISSLRSRFDFSRKRAVCVAADKVAVYHWHRGGLADSFVLDANEEGIVQFSRYLEDAPDIPVYLMADVVEEEFRLESIPHVFGSDRKALLERRQNRLFRGTPYFHAEVQGREPEGRRDDKVLMTALTNPDVIVPWLKLFSQHKVPLAGIYSLSLLSKHLLPHLKIKSTDVLLVSLQSASGLRQTFFRDGLLKISRLAKLPRFGTVPYGPYVLAELDKFRRYLNSLRLLSREGPLEIVVLSHGEVLDELKQQCHDSDVVRYRLVDMPDAARSLGMSGVLTTPFSDVLFAQLLLVQTPPNHYATPQETQYFRLHRTRDGMLAASVMLLLGGALWSGYHFIEGVSYKQQALDAQQKTKFYQARYQMAKGRLPPTPVEPGDIRTGVALVERLMEYKASPATAFVTLSGVLDEFPALTIDRIDWFASADPNAVSGVADDTESRPDEPAPIKGGRGISYRYYQIAHVEGRLLPFDGDYRAALDTVQRFAEALRQRYSVYDVTVEALPLDVSSEASLKGEASGETELGDARFALRVVIGVGAGHEVEG